MQLEAVVPLRAVGALVGEIPPAACRRRIPAALAGDRHGATAQREPARLRKQVASPCLRASAPAVASYSLAARLRNAFFWWGGVDSGLSSLAAVSVWGSPVHWPFRFIQ